MNAFGRTYGMVVAVLLAATASLLAGPLASPSTSTLAGFSGGNLIAPVGEAAGDRFGQRVAAAGDINGDGYPDVMVGAWRNDAGGTDAGRVYVYFGGPSMDDVADLILTGHSAGEQLGLALASAGDVNGDGYADLILGPRYGGRAYVYFGGAHPDSVEDLVLTGPGAFGSAVGTAGDVNGDGYADMIVGAPADSLGSATVFFGGSQVDAAPDLVVRGKTEDFVSFGARVGTAGDVNGDGYDDMLVAAPTEWGGGQFSGNVYLFFGGQAPDTVVDWQATTTIWEAWLGISMSPAGDVNADGYADFIIGTNVGDVAYVYFGGPGLDKQADLTLVGEAADDGFGNSVGGAGDINGDGYADLIVGALGNDAGGLDAGRAYVYLGGAGVDTIPDLVLTGVAPGDFYGVSVALAWDVNGDGGSEIIVGAARNDNAGTDAGRTYVVSAHPKQVGVWSTPLRPFRLLPPWPNPADGTVSIAVELGAPAVVTINAYDVAGRRVVEVMADRQLSAGVTVHRWRPGELRSGLYLLRARAGGHEQRQRFLWLRHDKD